MRVFFSEDPDFNATQWDEGPQAAESSSGAGYTLNDSKLLIVAGDPRTQGRVDNFYLRALDCYKDFTYKEFHKYIARKMEVFYKRHGFPATKAAKVVQEPDESQGAEIGDVVPVEGGSALNKSYVMSDSEEDEEERGAGTAAGGAEPAAAAAAAEPAAAANAGPA